MRIIIPEWIAEYNNPPKAEMPKAEKPHISNNFDEIFKEELEKTHQNIMHILERRN